MVKDDKAQDSKSAETEDNTEDNLENPSGGIFLVSNIGDKNAVDAAIAHEEVKEIDEQKSQKQKVKKSLEQLNRTDKLTSYDLDLHNRLGWHESPIVRLIQDVKKIRIKYQSKNINYKPIFLIALDKEDTDEFANTLKAALRNIGMQAYIVSILGESKTVSEEKKRSLDDLSKTIRRTYLNPDNQTQNFINWILNSHKPNILTGFDSLDDAFDGGLSSELYVLGAPSSIGKTTFAWQIANQIAAKHTHIFYYALEMTSNQLISKAISRLAYENADYGVGYENHPLIPDSQKIYRGRWSETWQEDTDMLVYLNTALEQYSNISQYIHIRDNMIHKPTASQIRKDVANFIDHTLIKPVVFVDYLQLLQSEEGDERQTDKQRVSDAIWTLKTISRDFDIPVIVISSFNRSSYDDTNAGMQAFKESGDIDYSAEVMLTLNYDFKNTKINNVIGCDSKLIDQVENGQIETIADWIKSDKTIDKRDAFNLAKRQPEKAIQLKMLKNRFGGISAPLNFITEPKYDIFLTANPDGTVNRVEKIIDHQVEIKNNQVYYQNEDINIPLFDDDLPF